MSAMTAAVFGSGLLAACSDDDDRRVAAVSAGSAVTTSIGKPVTLQGQVISGIASATAWTQTSGPIMALSGASSGTATFTAPAVTTTTPLGFQFSATSSDGIASVIDTMVTVTPALLDFTAVPKSLANVAAVPFGIR